MWPPACTVEWGYFNLNESLCFFAFTDLHEVPENPFLQPDHDPLSCRHLSQHTDSSPSSVAATNFQKAHFILRYKLSMKTLSNIEPHWSPRNAASSHPSFRLLTLIHCCSSLKVQSHFHTHCCSSIKPMCLKFD